MRQWNATLFSVMSIFTMNACASDGASGANNDQSNEAAQGTLLSSGACTAVTMTSPMGDFTFPLGHPVPLGAAPDCPPGQTAEFQYWYKQLGAPNWTHVPLYVPGLANWPAPSAGAWCVTVVVRALGAPEDYQARASAKCGVIAP